MNLDNALWQYALRLYAKPDVEKACLSLQSHGLSVNRLLHALWASEQGIPLSQCDLAVADTWRAKFTTEQRRLRYALRDEKKIQGDAGIEELMQAAYSAMKKAELACEQVELALLFQASEPSLAVDNLNGPNHQKNVDLALDNIAGVFDQAALDIAPLLPQIATELHLLLTHLSDPLAENWQERLLRD